MNNEKPKRCIQAADRITQMLGAEFDDLTPPDVHFVLSLLCKTYLDMFEIAVAKRKL